MMCKVYSARPPRKYKVFLDHWKNKNHTNVVAKLNATCTSIIVQTQPAGSTGEGKSVV